MRWSFRIARVLGIDIRIHLTFFLIVLVGAMQWSKFGMGGAAFGAALILLLFVCVTLHELGHSVVAKWFGIPVREIVLLPIGGVALLTKNTTEPLEELLIAIAGPAVNVVIAMLLSVYLGIGGFSPQTLMEAAASGPSVQTMLIWLLNVNIVLVVFNMVPAFPLDGGRVLRAVLGFFMSWTKATNAAAVVGQVLALLLGALGVISGNIILALIALFIFFAAGSIRADEQARAVLSTRRIGDAYNKNAIWLNEDEHVSRVVDYLLTSYQPDYPVTHDGELWGVISREQVLQSLSRSVGDQAVSDVMIREIPHVDYYQPIDQVKQMMEENASRIVAVYRDQRFMGLVNTDDLSEAMVLIAFEQRRQAAAEAPPPLPEGYARPA